MTRFTPATTTDDREVVTLHHTECRECSGHDGPTEDETETYRWQFAHTEQTGHRSYWKYTIQRGSARVGLATTEHHPGGDGS